MACKREKGVGCGVKDGELVGGGGGSGAEYMQGCEGEWGLGERRRAGMDGRGGELQGMSVGWSAHALRSTVGCVHRK